MLKKGDPAPDFTLTGHDDREYRLSDYAGQKVVLVFYPADFSPTCADQHACMRDDLAAFHGADAQVFGISVDSRWSHKAFAKQLGLGYPLLADFHPKGEVAARYGVFVPDHGVARRSTVIVGTDGRVADIIHYDFPEVPPTAPLVAALKAL